MTQRIPQPKVPCPFCGDGRSRVQPTTPLPSSGGHCRYRKCLACQRVYETIEVVRRAGTRRQRARTSTNI